MVLLWSRPFVTSSASHQFYWIQVEVGEYKGVMFVTRISLIEKFSFLSLILR